MSEAYIIRTGTHPSHNHDGDALTIGCPACIQRVRSAQECARWNEAPWRTCTWRFHARGHDHTFTVVVRVPPGAEPWQVDEWWAGETGVGISDTLAAKYGSLPERALSEAFVEACHTIRCTTIGSVVAVAEPAVDQLDLFGAAS